MGHARLPRGLQRAVAVQPEGRADRSQAREYLATRNVVDVERDFSAHRIAAQKVMEFPDLVAEGHLTHRGVWTDWQTADGDTFKGFGRLPAVRSAPRPGVASDPAQGYDTADVSDGPATPPNRSPTSSMVGVVKQSD